ENSDNKEALSNLYGNIGNVYRNLEDYERALEYYKRSLEIGEETGDIPNTERQLGNLGNTYSNLKQYELALEYQYKALQLSHELSSKSGVMTHLGNIGNTFVEIGRYAEAMALFNQAISIANEIGDKSSIAEWTELCGFIYSQKDYEGFNQATAEQYFLDSLAFIQEIGNKSKEFHLHKSLAELYKQQERWQEFAFHYERYHDLERKVQGLEAQKAADRFTHEREIAINSREQAILTRKNAELQEANEFKTKLLGIAAHDLKNPLSNIIGAANVVLSELPIDHEHREWIWIIEQSASRMSSLIIELLESSAASLGAMEFIPNLFNLGEMLHHVCELNTSALQLKHQKFNIHIEGDILISGDQPKLFQVFDNIISNSIKYSHKDAIISIHLASNSSTVLLKVQDEGQGLSTDDISKLFGQFQRLSSVPTDGESSTGLGLHITKHIVDLHNGRIWAESDGKGKGTTFHVELPIGYETSSLE
ncbi:MAG: tetratricopeptide repeat-containing sensor histidine kinase, partial [Ignavibacteriae bacterium]|nr:tetratricopeptide repeat-containing sensor histidine kinase [Ignavibacteriota bacterium]